MLLICKKKKKGLQMDKEQKKITKMVTYRLNSELVDEFRAVVKKSGYKQVYLIEKAMKEIIKELKSEK